MAEQYSHDEFCRRQFPALLAALLLFAVLHTLWSTSLDSFTIDEPYHITAGATYLRWHDYRINPEHPPLVKLVTALAEPASVLHLQPFSPLRDKEQERVYTQTAVFLKSDFHQVQRHARFAMIAFQTLLLGVLTVLLRRVFSPGIAIGTLLLLALDPTVSAHMPVVMTDLPMALLGTVCCCLAVLAVRCRRWLDWTLFGVATGLLMGTKHSAPLIVLPLLLGCLCGLVWQALRHTRDDLQGQLLRLAAAGLLAVAVLWSLYGFRFHESRDRDARGNYVETYNRPLADKIMDLHTPLLRSTLRIANKGHLLPRAYLWGLADTLRAGVEGRPMRVRAWGREYVDHAPWWIPLSDLVVKVPLPFTLLALAGLVLLCRRSFRSDIALPLCAFAAMFAFFMAFISQNGVYYAGLRHWLFAVPLMALFAAAAGLHALRSDTRWLRAVPVLSLLLIVAGTLWQRRIWEYHNMLVGGSGSAWKYFDNESVDLGQRSTEIADFYYAQIKPTVPRYGYWTLREQMDAENIPHWEPTPEQLQDGYMDGWFVMKRSWMPSENWKHIEIFRTIAPAARRGDAVFFHGRYYLPYACGGILIGQAMRQLNLPNGDRKKAELYLRRGVQMNNESPDAFVELANFALEHKNTAEELAMLRAAVKAETQSEQVRQWIREKIAAVEKGDTTPMRRTRLE